MRSKSDQPHRVSLSFTLTPPEVEMLKELQPHDEGWSRFLARLVLLGAVKEINEQVKAEIRGVIGPEAPDFLIPDTKET